MRSAVTVCGLVMSAAAMLVTPNQAAAQSAVSPGTPPPELKLGSGSWACDLPETGGLPSAFLTFDYRTDGIVEITTTRYADIDGVNAEIRTVSKGSWQQVGDRIEHSGMRTAVLQDERVVRKLGASQLRKAEANTAGDHARAVRGARIAQGQWNPILTIALDDAGAELGCPAGSGW